MLLLLAMLVVGVVYWFFGCPIRRITGVPCPGCGMTRALSRVATLRFEAAFQYHPLWPLLPVLAWLLVSKTAKKRPRMRNVGLGLVGVAFIVTWLLRLFVFSGLPV